MENLDYGKKYLGIGVAVALLIFAFSAASYVRTYAKSIEPATFRSFSVSGEGRVVAVPDIARFTFDVISEGGKDLGALQTANTQKVNAAIAFVKSKGVDAKDVKTEGYNVEPRYQNFVCQRQGMDFPGAPAIYPDTSSKVCPPPAIVGYTVRQTVSVKVRDFNVVGDVLSGVVQNGANSVSQLSFTIDDPTGVENEARAEAITKAKEKAEALAKAGGFRIGRLLSISEGGPQPYYGVEAFSKAAGFGMGGDAAPAPAPTIEPGSQEVRVQMFLTYGIK